MTEPTKGSDALVLRYLRSIDTRLEGDLASLFGHRIRLKVRGSDST